MVDGCGGRSSTNGTNPSTLQEFFKKIVGGQVQVITLASLKVGTLLQLQLFQLNLLCESDILPHPERGQAGLVKKADV